MKCNGMEVGMYRKKLGFIIIVLLLIIIFFYGSYENKYIKIWRDESEYYLHVRDKHIKILDEYKRKLGSINIDTSELIDYDLGDLTNDGVMELVVLLKGDNDSERILNVYENRSNNYRSMYTRTFKDMNPWKVEICDIDNNAYKELTIGMYKKTRYHPVMAKRPYVYLFKDKKMYPKWRGSRLARPFEDYVFYDIDSDGMDEIVSIEHTRSKRMVISVYEWIGFGFEVIKNSKEYSSVNKIIDKGNRLIIEVVSQGDNIECIEVLGLEDI